MKYLKKEMVDMILVVANIEHLLYIRHCFSDSQILTHLILIKKKSHKRCYYLLSTDK